MQPDAVQTQNKPFECRVILRRCSKSICPLEVEEKKVDKLKEAFADTAQIKPYSRQRVKRVPCESP